jgi:hypothetical protein
MSEPHPDVASLLAAQGIDAPEHELTTNGFSGARLTSLNQDGRSYVLKRLLFDDDWLMQLTHDTAYREAAFAVSELARQLPSAVSHPAIGAAMDGVGRAILMDDVSHLLFEDGHTLPTSGAEIALQSIAALHAHFWERPLTGIPFCPPLVRLMAIGPANAATLVDRGLGGFALGWQAFDRQAPPAAVALAGRLLADAAPLMAVIDAFPQTLLHGDLKSANFGIDGEVLTLFDWAMVMRGPVALDIGWMLAVNSSVLPWSLDETLDRYAGHLERALGPARFSEARWPEQRAVVMVCGLLMYGWGKALDAEDGRPDELRWWCDGALDAARMLAL